jgi:hypothetical protein
MTAAKRWFLGLALGLAAALGCAGCDGSCEGVGRTYEDGDHWTCSDGCNGCSCNTGTITSTAALCSDPPGPAAGKLQCFDRVWHEHGEIWTCPDGTECTCVDGTIGKKPG